MASGQIGGNTGTLTRLYVPHDIEAGGFVQRSTSGAKNGRNPELGVEETGEFRDLAVDGNHFALRELRGDKFLNVKLHVANAWKLKLFVDQGLWNPSNVPDGTRVEYCYGEQTKVYVPCDMVSKEA